MHRMPRVVALAVLTGLVSVAAMAAPVTIGLRAGSSIPNLHAGSDNPLSTGWSSRVAAAFGVFADVEVSPAFTIESELDCAPQGGKRDGLQATTIDPTLFGQPANQPIYANYKNTAKFNYLEIPVLARYRFGTMRRFSAALGPFAGFLLSAKNVTRGTSSLYYDANGTQPVEVAPGVPLPPQNLDSDTDVKSSLNSFNWGIEGGLGAAQPFMGGSLALDVRGGYGLTNIQKDTAADGKNNTGSLVVSLAWSTEIAHLFGH